MVLREARRDRFEIGDFAGRAAAGHSVTPRSVRWVRKVLNSMRTKRLSGPRRAGFWRRRRKWASGSTRAEIYGNDPPRV